MSLPEGLYLPKSTSAIAFPVSVPKNQPSTIAGTCSVNFEIVNGRPFIRTTTTGFPVSNRACTNSSCTPGIDISARLASSPLIEALSPIAAMTSSDWLAASTASEKKEQSVPVTSHPFA